MPQVRRPLGRAFMGAVLVSSALGVASTAAAATFTHRTVVTIDHTLVPGVASLTNFPVLVSLTSDNLRSTANGGFVTSPNGYDIIFQGEDAPTCGGTYPPACRLDHEIESYDPVNGTIVAWVRVPAIFGSLAGSNTPIYMYYGDATITCSQENKAGVWDAGYREVLHLSEPAEHTDSTTYGFTAASRGAVTEGVTGKIGRGVDLGGGTSGATVASLNVSDGTLPTATSFTVEAWVNFRGYTAGNYMGIVVKGRECLNFDGDPDPNAGFCTVAPCGDWTGLYNLPSGGNNRFSFEWAYGGGCKAAGLADSRAAPASTVQTKQWYHVAGTFTSGGLRRLYVNGAQVAVDAAAGACITNPIPHYTRLGTDSNQTYMDGQLDEVRISFMDRSAAWIQTGYNNQNNPAGFYSSISDQTGSWTVGSTACPAANPCAGGPGTCYLRSIGDITPYATGSGTCTATFNSTVVTCPGATWQASNRGRGDRITIDGNDYMVLSVDSDTQLRLSTPFTGTAGVGTKSYTLSRQFATPQAWENCISSGGAACTYFPVANGNLVTGNRSEIGVIYKEASPYTAAGAPIVNFNGSTTDATHTITLTADGVNRHYGIQGAGVVLDNGTTNTTRPVIIADQFVTVEWLEIARGGDTGAHCIDYVPSNAANHAVIRNNIIRNCSGQSIRLAGSATDHVADINNNIIYRGAREGVRVDSLLGTGTGSRVRIFNNTFLRNNGNTAVDWTEISTAETPNPYVALRNNIIVDDAQTPDVTWNGLAPCTNAANCDWWNAASSNNVTGDAAPATGQWKSDLGPNPHGGGVATASESSLNFFNTSSGSENLHLKMGSAAWNKGAALTGLVFGDIDAQGRYTPWDSGADELPGSAAPPVLVYSENAASGTRPLQYTTYSTSWQTPGTIAITGSPPFHTQPLHQKTATTGPNGVRAAVWIEDNPSGLDYLYASFWDGTNWDDGTGTPFADAQTGFFQPCWDGVLNLRCFDAAYEQRSGRLLVAYGVNTVHTIRYRRYDGAWGVENSTGMSGAFTGADSGMDGTFSFVRLAPRPGTNQIAFLGIADQSTQTPTYGAVEAAIWDGSAGTWGSKTVLSLPVTNGQNGHLTEAADIKFVLGGASVGEAIAVWGNGQLVYSARWSQAGGWTAGASIADLGAGNTVRWLRLAAKPQGDGMVLAVEDTNQRIFTLPYNGTTRVWGALSAAHTTTAYGSAIYNRPFDVEWDPGSGANRVLLVYSDPVRVRYRTSADGGATWTAEQTQDSLNPAYQAYWVQLVRDVNNTIHFAIQDAANRLRVTTYFSNNWLIPITQISANVERDANHAVEPFAIATYAPVASGTTAVKLMSFEATPADRAVDLFWQTGSELDNLGFHLYRGPSADGPWTRLTSTLIPGLGSSPLGQAYAWHDGGLLNGQRYYYRLEDVDTSSKSTFHGPVSAVPGSTTPAPSPGGGGSSGGSGGGSAANGSCPAWVLSAYTQAVPSAEDAAPGVECAAYGKPEAVSLREAARDRASVTLELRTGGFYAVKEPSGTVRAFAPGFDSPGEVGAPALPLRRALVDAVVGKTARLVSAQALDLRAFPGLRPSAVGQAELEVSPDGTVRPGRRAVAAPLLSRGYLPQFVARLAGTVFRGDEKSAVVELSPVRFDGSRQALVLAGRVVVRVAFTGREPTEAGSGRLGRRVPRLPSILRETLADLYTTRTGVHAVAFEALFPGRLRGLPVSALRLQRQGEAVAFRVEPNPSLFGPGSVLYFYADRVAPSTAYSAETAYELVRSTAGRTMEAVPAAPLDPVLVSAPTGFASFETNRIHQPAILAAEDQWLWERIPPGSVVVKPFRLAGLDATSPRLAELVVYLQGASDAADNPQDHHVTVSLNGYEVGEAYFDGWQPLHLTVAVPATALREGDNEIALANVGDTGVSSLVLLDRFTLSYPQAPVLRSGAFEGVWAESGTAEVTGLAGTGVVLDVTGGSGSARWLSGFAAGGASVRFRAEAESRYVVVSVGGLLTPRIVSTGPATLRDAANQADYLLIAPGSFLAAAQPLIDRRADQGLTAKAVSLEAIASQFGYGEASGEAIRAFVSYAYQFWRRPSPRYVVLLGDSTTDPRNFTGSSSPSPLPALWTKTSYLWTVSDPLVAAVNGDDPVPDLAVGRLPATTVAQAETMVAKLLAWEDSGQGLDGPATLVADNPDAAGDFEANARDVESSFLQGRPTTEIFLGQIGNRDTARADILDAFDQGLSLVSYVGHGGAAVWASENVLNSWDMASMQAQSRQPLVMTMNCLNGYFVAPNYESLSEALVKAEGRGAIATFSPSGLSLDAPAHAFHRALMAELVSGVHERLGDAVLAAQKAYAETGLMPELLSVYQLLGDPAMKTRP